VKRGVHLLNRLIYVVERSLAMASEVVARLLEMSLCVLQ
jgi:hypothetical protein